MATYSMDRGKDQIEANIRKIKTVNEQKMKVAEIQKAEKDLAEESAKGSLFGTGAGLLGAVGLSLLIPGMIPGMGGVLPALKAVLGSPVIAGGASAVGSYLGERLATKDEIDDIESLVDESTSITGPGSAEFGSSVETGYGDIDKDSKTSALFTAGTRGLQVGSIAGGLDSVGSIFKNAAPGSSLANIGQKLGYEYAVQTPGTDMSSIFINNFKKGQTLIR